MLKADYTPVLTPLDEVVFTQLVPPDHYLRRLKASVDFTPFRALVADCYAAELGRPGLDPVVLLKLLLLQQHYGWSDAGVCQQAQVNVALRFFLDWSLTTTPPDASLLTIFRQRLGLARWQSILQELVRQARGAGLVKDRLRLKDATHVIANIAVPATIQLVAQTRAQLLAAAEPFAPAEVAAHRQAADELRAATSDQPNDVRLLRRVEHLRTLITWGAAWQARLDLGAPPVAVEVYEAFATALTLARKVLQDRQPNAPDQLRSLTDVEARRSKHGEYYDGYLLDVLLDADSELITALDVLPANGDEAANAESLIKQEEQAQGNDVAALSLDRIGFNGPVLQALSEATDGPQLTVYVPPKPAWSATPDLFQPTDFRLNEAGDELTCPGGQTTRTRYRDTKDHAWQYHFRAAHCRTCPLRAQCVTAKNQSGRTVTQNDYQAQYDAARQRATTDDYQQIRQAHPAIERKLNELVRWHDGRRVRYRGRLRVQVQYLILAVVVNCKRIVRLLHAAPSAAPA
jgi:transposase